MTTAQIKVGDVLMGRTLIQHIASTLTARQNCITSGNTDWKLRHEAHLNALADMLPSGSGIDNGTAIDWNASTSTKIVLQVPFHHMDEYGGYDGWTDHTLTVRPSFDGIDITVSGRNRNGIKDYLAETFDYALTRVVEQVWSDSSSCWLGQA